MTVVDHVRVAAALSAQQGFDRKGAAPRARRASPDESGCSIEAVLGALREEA